MALTLRALLAALLACSLASGQAAAKGVGITPARAGVALPGSPYRYVTLNPRNGDRINTVAMGVEREGGRIDRWLRLRGQYYVPAPAYDLRGGGLSGDGSTLVLQRFTPAYPPRRSRFAVLDTGDFLPYPAQPGEEPVAVAVRRIDVPGFYSLHAVSPDGETAYLNRHLVHGRSIARFELRAVDLTSGHLLPGAVEPSEPMEGLPITQLASRDGRRAYTLYDGNAYGGGTPFLLALDTAGGDVTRVALPQLRDRHRLFLTKMRLAAGGSKLAIFRDSAVQWRPPTPPLVMVDTETFAVRDARTALMALGRSLVVSLADFVTAREDPLLAFARTPRRPGNLLGRFDVVGHSAQGRPIELHQMGDPKWSGELLVFGCVHGDECGASAIKPTTGGCPDPSADVYLVPNLNPDGAAEASRLNGRGVDLNRNFPSEWEPIQVRWDPQYSGPRPFSEPESRLAARIIRHLRPEATVWFHQYPGTRPFVRAWGRSAIAGRRFARLARMPFRLMRWPAGTAPNWQNHRFRGAASFVVELPAGRLEPEMEGRLTKALVRMARWVRED
ncbi:MAG TPA: M14 family zinc carboxypeptidase [Solirubrobacterales bacterium]|nr:M14 family zinc carboxypeptidase [Solirubrobacterales bacterium]